LRARGMLQEGTNAVLGKIPLVPQPVQFSESSHPATMRVPILGEDTDAVLRTELGMNESNIAELRTAKVI
jgi:CoA:oxalate CoA-transferase